MWTTCWDGVIVDLMVIVVVMRTCHTSLIFKSNLSYTSLVQTASRAMTQVTFASSVNEKPKKVNVHMRPLLSEEPKASLTSGLEVFGSLPLILALSPNF